MERRSAQAKIADGAHRVVQGRGSAVLGFNGIFENERRREMASHIRRFSVCSIVAFACASGASLGCSAELGSDSTLADGSDATEVGSESATQGTVLLELELEPGFFARMVELEPGVVEVSSEFNVDEVRPAPLFSRGQEPTGVVDMYKLLLERAGRPVTDEAVPQKVRDAQGSVDRRIAEATALGFKAPQPMPEVENESPVVQLQGECSPDVYGDNYGARWFADVWCSELSADRQVATNVPSGSLAYGFVGTHWSGYSGMAADFWQGARGTIGFYRTVNYHIFFGHTWTDVVFAMTNEWIPPRWVKSFVRLSYGGYVKMAGEGPCPRVHLCKMWGP